jgi:imidazolonepropionase-like amidohydrolase
MTRMAEVAMLRQRFENARAYKPSDDKPRDFAAEALAGVLKGEILAQNHCYRADEMLVRLDLYAEFGARPRAFHHAVEAYKIRDQLARAGVGAVVWADWAGLKLELEDAIPANAALLDAAGVRVALHSDSPYDIQHLNQEAAKAMAAGRRAGLEVTREAALRWITANPAWVLGIDGRVGTLEPGKDADLVLWSGDPFSVYTRADRVWIEGRPVFDRANPGLPRSDFELGLERSGEAP